MQIALTIAGSDSGGGAGVQADLKTFQSFGVYGTSVITAVTAQNTLGVTAVHTLPAGIVRAQLAALASDLPAAAVKTGMLATTELVQVVADALDPAIPYVCDPVMVATSGDRLLEPRAERVILERLIPLAAMVTPNLDEAAILTGLPVHDPESMERAGKAMLDLGAGAALITGGHLRGEVLVDLLVTRNGTSRFEHPRIHTTSTHGTGCTLSAAITAGLARRVGGRAGGREVPIDVLIAAVSDAIEYVHRAIATAPGLGKGHGPVA
jgi:hydroxymethylpyrimidine kinase/phosphomethylpyrimidine kinase